MKKFAIFGIMFCILATICCAGLSFASTTAYAEGVDVTSKAAYLIDQASGTVLYQKEAQKHLPVASMVKMMTIYLTLKNIQDGNLTLDTPVQTSENASGMGGSQIFIDPFVEYRAEDLLKGVIIASANDASVALAEHIAGSERAFVEIMNQQAKDFGMMDTNYVNCTGLPAPEQYSCAKDSALLLSQVMQFDLYHKYSTIWMDEVVHPSGRKTELVNTNRLIRYYEGCDGGKTGSTNEAGCCLCASAKRGDTRLISVVIGSANSQTRFNECSGLFNYGFTNFENKKILDSQLSVKTLPVAKGKSESIMVYPAQNFSKIVKRGQNPQITVDYVLPQSIKAPIKAGDKVGSALISQDGNVLGEVELVVKDKVDALSLGDCFNKVAYNW